MLKDKLVHWLINVTWSHFILHPSLSGKDHSTFGGRDGSFLSNVIRNKCKSPGKQPAFYNAITVSLRSKCRNMKSSILMMCHYPDLGRASDYSCHDYRNFASIAASSSPICTCDSYLQLVNKNALHHNTFSKLYARNEVLLKISKLLENIKQY